MIVLDARPHQEGRVLLRNLLKAGLCASYCLLNAAAYIISEATKVRFHNLYVCSLQFSCSCSNQGPIS